jgi:hypothetical protein
MLLENPTHSIVVHTGQLTTDTYGNEVLAPSTLGVEIRCRLTPASASRDRSTSRVDEVYKVLTGDTSTSKWIRVRFDDRWYTVDDWKLFDSTPSTRHIEAIIREES